VFLRIFCPTRRTWLAEEVIEMLSYALALEQIRAAAGARIISETELVGLKDAVGRVVAADVDCPAPIPAFDNSAMDGFALVAASALAPGAILPVLGTIRAGDAPRRLAAAGAWRIMTGAPLPEGCDAVVPVERARIRSGEGSVELLEAVSPGDWVRGRGRDFAAGARICAAGSRLAPRHLLALAAAGIEKILVWRRPRVALIATGSELAPVGEALGGGMIRDANSVYVGAALTSWGVSFTSFGVVRDEPMLFRSVFLKALAENFDVILTTGAVSMGDADFIPSALTSLGAETLFHKVAVRPGKPLLLTRFARGPLCVGLPGNPVSTASGLRFFVEPLLRELLGRPAEVPLRAHLLADVEKPAALRCFYRALRAPLGQVETLADQASFQIHSLIESDAWAILPEGPELLRAGTEVDVVPLLEPDA
jgi:molybdopterin molybdotransferase